MDSKVTRRELPACDALFALSSLTKQHKNNHKIALQILLESELVRRYYLQIKKNTISISQPESLVFNRKITSYSSLEAIQLPFRAVHFFEFIILSLIYYANFCDIFYEFRSLFFLQKRRKSNVNG